MSRLLEFIRARIGTQVNEPGGIDGECVSLVNRYLGEVLGLPPVRANAVDWAGFRRPGMSWVPNRPINAPLPGDVVVWRETPSLGIGPFGHVAVAVLADALSLVTFDQNWPEGSPAALICHRSYAGVMGWFSPLPTRPAPQSAATGR